MGEGHQGVIQGEILGIIGLFHGVGDAHHRARGVGQFGKFSIFFVGDGLLVHTAPVVLQFTAPPLLLELRLAVGNGLRIVEIPATTFTASAQSEAVFVGAVVI